MKQENDVSTRVPTSTYRFQFNRFFTFAQARDVVPYLHRLGIGDVYASPYLKARPGSLHGYDISDHSRLNPEIGADEYPDFVRALRKHGMGQLLDIVPNHMGIGQAGNPWWMDVLENGPSSPFAPYFDIDWKPLKTGLAGRVLLPVLGDQFGKILENGELQLRYDEGRFRLHYHEHEYPVSPKSSSLVLRAALEHMKERQGELEPGVVELESIVTALEHLPPRDRTDEASVAERRRESLVTRRRLSELNAASGEFRAALGQALETFNGREGEPHSFDLLDRLLDDQAYRLAYWRVAAEEINYRRFFDINDLAGVRVERPQVFQETHELILRLVDDGTVTGLRIDHPDGLYNPVEYLRHLREECALRSDATPFYVLVEKILTGDEPLPESWPVSGTVGYEFLNRLNGLFVDTGNGVRMESVYSRFIGRTVHFTELVYEKKKLILRAALASELNVLAHLLNRVSERNRRSRDFTLGSLTDALREIIACFPVYRTYIDAHVGRVSDADREYIERAIRIATRRNRTTSSSLFDFIRDTLLLVWPDNLDDDARKEHARFVMKFQQLTGPVMAKGVEDTSFYVYNRLISLNEVGGEPDRFGTRPAEFHRWIAKRQASWPHALNSTSTHDTKRSEDVRARINVLSEIPDEWEDRVARWAELNQVHRIEVEGESIPDRNDEYLLYQTLVGALPLEPLDEDGRESFIARIQQYMEKATREAKVHTSWINPNEAYDQGLKDFVRQILGGGDNPFLADLVGFHARIARAGAVNSLSQTLIKLTCPGVPDVYQGQEIWDFSLVDPDNRRAVDYEQRRRLLEELEAAAGEDAAALAARLAGSWREGGPKLRVVQAALGLRRDDPELFALGEYLPIDARGSRSDQVVAFARRHGDRVVLVVAPRLPLGLVSDNGPLRLQDGVWGDTALEGDHALLGGRFRNLLDGKEVEAEGEDGRASIPLRSLTGWFPVALLERVR